jgi:hypothetical protein
MACSKSILTDWRTFRRLPAGQRWLLLQGLALLPLTALALRWLGVRRWQACLARWLPAGAPVPHRDPEALRRQAETTARLVDVASRRGLHRGNCLQRSLVLWWLLRRHRIESEVRLGVRLSAGRLLAHAWVECQGEVLDDRAGARAFAPFDRALVPPEGTGR